MCQFFLEARKRGLGSFTPISAAVFKTMDGPLKFFSLSRGVRQGFPLSPYIFIFCAEVLGNSVRNDPGIQGVKVLDNECKISQYADDTTFILDGSQSSLSRSLYLLETFALISGLQVNYEKTDALWIGSCKSSEITLPSSKPILWAKYKVYALRVWFSTLEDTPAHISFSEKIDKLQSTSILNSCSTHCGNRKANCKRQ